MSIPSTSNCPPSHLSSPRGLANSIAVASGEQLWHNQEIRQRLWTVPFGFWGGGCRCILRGCVLRRTLWHRKDADSELGHSHCFLTLPMSAAGGHVPPSPHGSPYGTKCCVRSQPETLPCILPASLDGQVMKPVAHRPHSSTTAWWHLVKGQTGTVTILDPNRKTWWWCLPLGVWWCSSGVEPLILAWPCSDAVMRAADEEGACWWHLLPPAPKQDVPQMAAFFFLFDLSVVCLFRVLVLKVSKSKNQTPSRNPHRISWSRNFSRIEIILHCELIVHPLIYFWFLIRV